MLNVMTFVKRGKKILVCYFGGWVILFFLNLNYKQWPDVLENTVINVQELNIDHTVFQCCC